MTLTREQIAWNAPDTIPPVKARALREYIVAIYRKNQEKVYTCSAVYLNAYPLEYDDDSLETDDEGLTPTTGWCDSSSNFEYDNLYTLLTFNNGDKFMGWFELPTWDALQAPQFQPAPNQPRKETP